MGESPSPLELIAALIPPCAQTECERLTFVTEISLTLQPCSASFMAAERPARPPPTTITSLVCFILLSSPNKSARSLIIQGKSQSPSMHSKYREIACGTSLKPSHPT